MTRWKDGKLDLGALGALVVTESTGYAEPRWWWGICHEKDAYWQQTPSYKTASAAKRAAISWLRRALKQASKRVEG
jgi:hypothetical protein